MKAWGLPRRLENFLSLCWKPHVAPRSQTQVTDAHKRNAATTRLREIPSVDEVLGQARLRALAESAGREIVSEATRSVLADIRAKLLNTASAETDPDPGSATGPTTVELIEERIADR